MKPKRWRAKPGMKYYSMEANSFDLDIDSTRDFRDMVEAFNYNFGNYFKTKKQALAAAKKIKRVLRGEK